LVAAFAGGLAGAVVCASTGAVSMLAATSAAANVLNMGSSFFQVRGAEGRPAAQIAFDRLSSDLGREYAGAALNST
jgi:hypothetical protein